MFEKNRTSAPLRLLTLPGSFAICKLAPNSPLPTWAAQGEFFSITRTSNELSIVCLDDQVPPDIPCSPGWRCLRVAGAMPFSIIGVLSALTAPLATAGISAFAVSTFDTDYLLTRDRDFIAAIEVLRESGHVVD